MAKEPTTKAKRAQAPPSPMEEWVGRARGAGMVVGFLISFLVCRGAGFPVADAVLRGLAGAAVLCVVAWWSALLVIQALMRAAAAQAQREAQAAAAQTAAAVREVGAAVARSAAGEGGSGWPRP